MLRYAIVFRPEAEDEVLEARQWYESRSEGWVVDMQRQWKRS